MTLSTACTLPIKEDGAALVSEETKIYNGHLDKPEYPNQETETINKNWIKLEESSTIVNWQWLLDTAKSITEEI